MKNLQKIWTKIIVVEEKRSIIETQVKEILFNKNLKVKVIGKKDENSNDLFVSSGALDPGEIGLKIYEIIKYLQLPEDVNNFSMQLKSLTESTNSNISLKESHIFVQVALIIPQLEFQKEVEQ